MYKLIKPFLFKIEPEKAHGLTIDALKTLQKFPVLFPVVDKLFTYKNPTLSQTIQGNTYDNPIGLANLVSTNLAKYQKHWNTLDSVL